MGVQVVGEDIRVDAAGAFAGAMEVLAEVPRGLVDDERLLEAQLSCQQGVERVGLDCLACTRFRGFAEGPGPSQLTISCAWTDLAPVWARMTLASQLVCVDGDLDCATALELAASRQLHHLVVSAGTTLDGVICCCDLRAASAGERVRDRMAADVFAIRSRASLGEAVAAMSQLGIGCLPVVEDGRLVGVLTRGDLRRAGVPEAILGDRHCATCGSYNGVRTDPRTGADACLGCIAEEERIGELDAYEFGEGD
jgi:hypothetical protein